MQLLTSWDDGRKDDLKLAELLEKYGATGTFYVSPPQTHEKPALTDDDIRLLSQKHEIGAHTMTHPRLTKVPIDDAKREIEESKKWIEGITGKPCTKFCYPCGEVNSQIRDLVKDAGFSEARTVEQLEFKATDPFLTPTTLQIYPFPIRRRYTRWWHCLDPLGRLRVFFPKMIKLRLPPSAYLSWLELAKALFNYAQETNQPFFHLWGHSWEVEKYKMWNDLEKFLEFTQER